MQCFVHTQTLHGSGVTFGENVPRVLFVFIFKYDLRLEQSTGRSVFFFKVTLKITKVIHI